MAVTLKYLLVFLALSCGVNSKTAYKICVPSQFLKACEDMLEVPTKSKVTLECVPARDRIEMEPTICDDDVAKDKD